MARKSKKNPIAEMQQTHAALTSPRSVEQIMGMGNTYKVGTLIEYQTQIKAMTDADLYDHAYNVGITPVDPRMLLEDRLEKHFLTQMSKNIFQVIPSTLTDEAKARQARFLQGLS